MIMKIIKETNTMRKLLTAVIILALGVNGNAALISRTYTYTDGNTMTANENNTNENTLYNEINGNLSTANILDSTIQNGDIGDTQIAVTKFASIVQSSFTYLNTLGAYRRPNLKYVSVTSVDVEANTGTSNETCIQFPDQRRCVTENTGSTSVNRRFIITESAAVSGTKNSGLFSGESEGNNLWYALYAVKTTDVATDFVIIGSTKTPVQGNYATLNTNFGTNSWVFLGMIRNGDNATATGDILQFTQTSNITHLINGVTSNGVVNNGLLLATTAGATSLTYNVSAGVGTAQIPDSLGGVIATLYYTLHSGGGAGTGNITFGNNQPQPYFRLTESANRAQVALWTTGGAKITGVASTTMDVILSGWIDPVLGVGFNPQL